MIFIKRALVVYGHSLLEKRPRIFVSLLLLVFIVLGAVSIGHDTLTCDEPRHLSFGDRLLAGELEHSDMQRMPVSALNAIPQRAMNAVGLSAIPPLGIWLSRQPTIFFSALLGWFVFYWSRRCYGTKSGLFSLFLFVFCPTAMAHGRLVTTDMYCALFFFLAIMTFWDYIRKPSWPRILLAAGAMGVAQLTKQTALLLFPILLTVFFLNRYATRHAPCLLTRPFWRRWLVGPVLHGFCFVLITLAIVNAGYRFRGTFETLDTHRKWLLAHEDYQAPAPGPRGIANKLTSMLSKTPLPLPRAYVESILLGQYYNQTGKGHGPVYLLGSQSKLGWKSYFPIAFLLKTPLPTLILIFIAVYVCLRTKRLRLDSVELVLLGSASSLFVYFTFFCTAQIGVRYLLPVLPLLYVFSGQLAISFEKPGKRVWRACLTVLLLWLPVSSLSYFPHYISYFNEICWNRLHLYKYLADSNLDWGQNGYYLSRYLEAHQPQVIPVDPPSLTPGTIIVGVNNLVGLNGNPATYRVLRDHYTPTAHVAYSWLEYKILDPPTK